MSDEYLSDTYLDVSIADRMIFTSYRLYDPARSYGTAPGGFCLGDPDQFELAPNTVLVDIDAQFTLPFDAIFCGDGFQGDYLQPDDGQYRQRLFDATYAANPTSDQTLVSTALHRPWRFSDGIPLGELDFDQLINSKEPINA